VVGLGEAVEEAMAAMVAVVLGRVRALADLRRNNPKRRFGIV
jgi:hypothetical protein